MTYSLFSGLSHNALLGSSPWHGGLGRLRRGCNAGKKKERNLNVYLATARAEYLTSQSAEDRRIFAHPNGYTGLQ